MVTALSAQIAKYKSMQATLEADHVGKWVVLYDEELIGAYPAFEDAAEEAVRRFGRGPYLIRQVGAPPMTLPPSLLYRPIHADH